MPADDTLRSQALKLFQIAVASADPRATTVAALERGKARIEAANRICLIALGKAASAMAGAALPFVRDKLAAGVVVTTDRDAEQFEGLTTIVGGHPEPTEGSFAGGRAILDAASACGEGDLVIVLISGGGSALAVAPPDGVTLADKKKLTELLLRSGADITAMNTVRGAVSRLKAGGLARASAPANVLSLILSDVPGDDIAIIASGPTAPVAPNPARAAEILRGFDLTGKIPQSIAGYLDTAAARPPLGPAPTDNVLIGSNAISVAALETALKEAGRTVIRIPGWLSGDVGEVSVMLFDKMREAAAMSGPAAVIAGGETTVNVCGSGRGGRNQELALRVALLERDRPIARKWTFLSGGTDGRDGPTDAAGGIVDAGTLARMEKAGVNPLARLADNDAYVALDAAGDLIDGIVTGTNVADVQIALID